MKNTKEKILATALDLFNANGLSKVTLRTIAKKMGISQGNLNYHFKKRDDIIEFLYFELVSTIDKSMIETQSAEINLKLLFDLSKSIMTNFYTYRFFLLDFVQIMKDNKIIKSHYLKLSELREDQFTDLFTALVKKKIMRKEELPNEYCFLYTRFQILGDFWISSAEVVNKRISKRIISNYYTIIIQAIYPYLTPKGKKEYHSLMVIS